MKKLILLLAFSVPFPVFGQIADNTNENNESNIYNQAIIQYLIYLKESSKVTPDTLWIEDLQNITDKLIVNYSQTKIIKLKEKDYEAIFKNKEFLTLHKMYPLEFEDTRFSIRLVPFKVTMDKKNGGYTFAYSGTCVIYFDFKDNKFIYDSIVEFRM